MSKLTDLFGNKVIGYVPTPEPVKIEPTNYVDRPKQNIQTGFTGHIRANHITVIPEYERNHSGNRFELERNKSIVREKLSKASAKKVSNSVRWLINTARWKKVFDKKAKKNVMFKINFITLTLPHLMWQCLGTDSEGNTIWDALYAEGKGFISDHFFKTILMHKFFGRMQNVYGVQNYVVKYETQQNGNIHAHITTNKFIHYLDVRKEWNKILNEFNLLDNFFAEHGHRDANTTDIHAVYNEENMAEYVAAELAKKLEGRRPISGRLWACSHELSKLHHEKIEFDRYDQNKYLKHLNDCKTIRKIEIVSKKKIADFGRELYIGTLYCWTNILHCPAWLISHYQKIVARMSVDDLFNYSPEAWEISYA